MANVELGGRAQRLSSELSPPNNFRNNDANNSVSTWSNDRVSQKSPTL